MRSKKITKYPDYNRTAKVAKEFILKQKINKLPVNPFEIAKDNNWVTEKASQVAKDIGVSIYRLLNDIVKSKDGAAMYCGATKEYKILYNDTMKNKNRIRWTMTHEIGHIVLGHHKYDESIIARGGLSQRHYRTLEMEADFFASLVLAPPVVLHKLKVKSPNEIAKICKLSKQASKNRYRYYLRWKNFKKDKRDLVIAENFYDFINQKRCNNCGYGFVSEKAKYCPVCGKIIKWGKGKMKYRNFVELNKNGRAIICPKCDNEDIGESDQYCKICGSYLYQECQERKCEVKLDSNARHCTQCGGITTFYYNEFLEKWDTEKEEIDDKLRNLNLDDIDDDFDVPF